MKASHGVLFADKEDEGSVSSVDGGAEVECCGWQSLLCTSPATGGSFISPVCSRALILPRHHEYACVCFALGSKQQEQLCAVLMSQNILIAVFGVMHMHDLFC